MAQKTSPRTGKNRTEKQQAVYRRRRIVVGVALVVVLSFIVFCLYSLSQGIVAVNREIHHADVYAISRKEVPTPTGQQKKSSVPDCDASDIALSVTPAASSLGVGDSMDFAVSVKYNGTSKAGCLIDVSQSGTVLTIKSGKDVIWKSDVCPVNSDYRLLVKGDEVKQTITWPGVRSGSACADAADLPKVDRGVYSAQLSVKGHAKTKSEPVGITVE
ncbi:hypothetical protein [Bifidobacterium ruminantium]|uniref:Uncharacterized protein n=1 Tax=Bifidobacterium ruminantium TaxID=78346 RepID=A0A087D5J1_BIFRU|nr:hypothetical protein [Bifidobacterium ruminantium]KFI90791.1 hypothetical protein BRUM_0037 [Bifidobacterium ruminantium]